MEKNHILIIAVVAVAIIAIGCAAFFLMNNGGESEKKEQSITDAYGNVIDLTKDYSKCNSP